MDVVDDIMIPRYTHIVLQHCYFPWSCTWVFAFCGYFFWGETCGHRQRKSWRTKLPFGRIFLDAPDSYKASTDFLESHTRIITGRSISFQGTLLEHGPSKSSSIDGCLWVWRAPESGDGMHGRLRGLVVAGGADGGQNTSVIRVCLKIGYIPNYSHLIGIMIINHWV